MHPDSTSTGGGDSPCSLLYGRQEVRFSIKARLKEPFLSEPGKGQGMTGLYCTWLELGA